MLRSEFRGGSVVIAVLLACNGPEETSSDGSGTTSAGPGSTTGGDSSGEAPTSTASTASTTGESTGVTSSTVSTTTSGGVCGDGVVDLGEACDDGNEDADDGCDACSPSGVALWTVTSEPLSAILAVAFDPSGNIVLAGYQDEQDGFYLDALVRKLAPDGKELMAFTFDGANQYDDWAAAVTVAPDGHLYVAGLESLPFGGKGFIRKYDPAGKELWVFEQVSTDPQNGTVGATGVSTDGATIAAVFVEEFSGNLATTVHAVALDPSGGKLWADVIMDGLYAFSAAHAPNGDIVVAGGQFSGQGDDHDGLVVRYSAGGQELWRRRYLDGPDEDGKAFDLDISQSGDIALTGEVFSDAFGYDIWVARLDPQGSVVWTAVHESPDFDTGFAVAWRGEELYVGGELFVEGEYDNRWVGHFSGDGSLLWTSSGDLVMQNGGVSDIATSETMVVAAGYEDVDVGVPTQWIRAYQP